MQRFDEPFLPFGKAVIATTADLVCAYVFHLASYLALGAAGAVALERTIAYVPSGVIKILHGPSATADYVLAITETAFDVHAVTLVSTVESATIAAYVQRADQGVFVESSAGIGPARKPDYPGQVGVYRQARPGYNVFSLPPVPDVDWYWQEAVYPSVGDDFHEAIREAATQLRRERTRPD